MSALPQAKLKPSLSRHPLAIPQGYHAKSSPDSHRSDSAILVGSHTTFPSSDKHTPSECMIAPWEHHHTELLRTCSCGRHAFYPPLRQFLRAAKNPDLRSSTKTPQSKNPDLRSNTKTPQSQEKSGFELENKSPKFKLNA